MTSSMVNIMGVDPGFASTGVAIVKGKGVEILEYSFTSIHTSKDMLLPARLNRIFSQFQLLVNEAKPDLMIIEDVFSLEKYPKSGISLGKVSGVILLAAAQHAIPVSEISVRETKRILTGNGTARKEQLERAVRQRLNAASPIKPFHASDALALAVIGLYRFREILSSLNIR